MNNWTRDGIKEEIQNLQMLLFHTTQDLYAETYQRTPSVLVIRRIISEMKVIRNRLRTLKDKI